MNRKIISSNKRLDQVAATVEYHKQSLALSERRIRHLVKETFKEIEVLNEKLSICRSELKDAERIKAVYENELEELRQRLNIAEDVTIPGLVKSHALRTQIYDADISANVRRQTMLSVEELR